MNAFLTLWRKEVGSYFLSPIAYVVTIFFLVVMGFSFWMMASALVQGPTGVTVMNELFASFFFWLTLLIVVPVLTMRLISEEKKAGTIETLMTAPVSDVAIVLAKFAGVLTFFILMWLPTLLYVLVLKEFSSSMAPIDMGPILGGYLGAFLVGSFYLAIGLFCSSVTSNQIVAAIMCFALITVAFFAGFMSFLAQTDLVKNIGEYISSLNHMLEFSLGAFDTRPVVLYVTGTLFMLFATVKVVEARRWK